MDNNDLKLEVKECQNEIMGGQNYVHNKEEI